MIQPRDCPECCAIAPIMGTLIFQWDEPDSGFNTRVGIVLAVVVRDLGFVFSPPYQAPSVFVVP